MTIYIAGPMTGIVNDNREGFNEAEAFLKAKGHTALNPALLPRTLDDKKYLPICIAMLEACDAIYMLDGWDSSLGATCERLYALRQGKTVYYEEDL